MSNVMKYFFRNVGFPALILAPCWDNKIKRQLAHDARIRKFRLSRN